VLKVVLIRAAVTLAGAVKGLTLSQRKAAKALLESSHVTYLLKLTQRFGCNGDGDEIAPLRDVSSDYCLLKQHA